MWLELSSNNIWAAGLEGMSTMHENSRKMCTTGVLFWNVWLERNNKILITILTFHYLFVSVLRITVYFGPVIFTRMFVDYWVHR